MLTSNKAVYGVDGSLGTLGNRGGASGGLTPGTQVNIPGEDPMDLDEYIETLSNNKAMDDLTWKYTFFEGGGNYAVLSLNGEGVNLPPVIEEILEPYPEAFKEIAITVRCGDTKMEVDATVATIVLAAENIKRNPYTNFVIPMCLYIDGDYKSVNLVAQINVGSGDHLKVTLKGPAEIAHITEGTGYMHYEIRFDYR